MNQAPIQAVTELLNEEKWTRAALNSYTISSFAELDETVNAVMEAEVADEAQRLCEEHLAHTRNSIIALYISGIIALNRRLVDDSNLVRLISIFADNHKWSVVEHLCSRILQFGENKFALRTLAECYEKENEEEKRIAVWERLIKVDYEEADIARALAQRREDDGNEEAAIEYYKKAIHRYINRKMFSNVKEVWDRLVELRPDDVDFFFMIERKVVQALDGERAATLLSSLYPYYRDAGECDTAIEILKRILQYEPKNQQARGDIVDCFREKYKEHSQLEEYVRISNLTQSWRNVHDAIADFEKHIAFDVGNFVYHRSWGIGKIIEMHDDEFTIDFVGRKSHKMSLKMAVSALTILPRDHIWVLRSITRKAELKQRILDDVPWALKTVIRSFDNAAGMKKIKEELVPAILSPHEWTKWNTEARKVLKRDSDFGNLPDDLDKYTVRETPISFEEKIFNRFRAERTFFDRVKTIREFLSHAEPDSEYFAEMFSYFTGILGSFSVVDETVMCSFFLVDRIVSDHPYLDPGFQHTFASLFQRVDDVDTLFRAIEDPELKKDFLLGVKAEVADWPSYYVRLFLQYPDRLIIDELVGSGRRQELSGLVDTVLARYRDLREPFVWMVRNLLDEDWIKPMKISAEKGVIGMVHLLEITYREIASKREVAANRKLNRQIQDHLFKDHRVEQYLATADESSAGRVFTLINDVKELDPSIKIALRNQVQQRFPGLRFVRGRDQELVRKGMLTTRRSYEEKQKALRNLVEVEIPANAKEVGTAMAKGDLRENAEYKAAKEKQGLLQSAAARLKEDLQHARLFDPSDLDGDSISFGTIARVRNLSTQDIEEYTILGPWESNPAQRIISYLSPFGAELCRHGPGDELHFSINDKEHSYRVEEVQPLDIDALEGGRTGG